MNNKVRKITEGAMMVAIIGIFMTINRQLAGLLDIYAAWLVPLPLALYSVKYGWKSATIPFVSVLFLSFIISTPASLFYIVSAGLCGIVYGNGAGKSWSNRRLLLTTMVFTIFSNLITMVLFASFFGYDIGGEMNELSKTVTSIMGDSLPAEVNIALLIKVSVVLGAVISGVLEGLIVHLLSHLVMRRLKIKIIPPQPLSQLKAPKWLGYVCFACFCATVYSMFHPNLPELVQMILIALGCVSSIVLIAFGYICGLVFGAVKYKTNLSFTLMLMTLLLFPVMVPVLFFLGFLYITTDMRERMLQ